MKIHADPADRTNFMQSLMHMIKGNLGTGILAMPATFNHCGLVNAVIGLPFLCLVATYCVHLLLRSSQRVTEKLKESHLEYAELARGSIEIGPECVRPYARAVHRTVDGVLVVCQVGICCVYLVFIVDNVTSILATYNIIVNKNYLFLAILPIALLLSYIRTLRRLAIASACANLLQVIGLSIVVEYLLRDMPSQPRVEYFKPASEVALGFGSAMFAFEGISVVLPVYARMKRQEQMGSLFGIINISYILLLLLYMTVGLLGYLRFGSSVADSITLNLPKVPLYDVVRAIFTTSLFLSYPLQFYVPAEIIWGYLSARLTSESIPEFTPQKPHQQQQQQQRAPAVAVLATRAKQNNRNEYFCRTVLVLTTFLLAASVPKLNLMMDFFGSISGTALSITLPALIHVMAFWNRNSKWTRALSLFMDIPIIVFGLVASANGSYFSFLEIVKSFHEDAHFKTSYTFPVNGTALSFIS